MTLRGIPKLIVTGLAQRVISEAKERILASLRVNQIPVKSCRTIINLFPSDLPKKDNHLELALLVDLLKSYAVNSLRTINDQDCFIGSLGLDGSIKSVKKSFALVASAQELGFKRIFVPESNLSELYYFKELQIIPLNNVKQLLTQQWQPYQNKSNSSRFQPQKLAVSINQLLGNQEVKRLLTIVAAGAHHLLLTGPPGSGKTLIAQSLLSLLPELVDNEAIEVARIHSAVTDEKSFTNTPPFRTPHYRISPTAMAGGGIDLKPGEMTLAHRGILFLDELNLFNEDSLNCLREPMETGLIQLNNLGISVQYPANFTLIAANNPCPCGFYGSQLKTCSCNPWIRERYQQKIPQAILDRIDLFYQTSINPKNFILDHDVSHDNLTEIKNKISLARKIQQHRYQHCNCSTNSQLTGAQVKELIYLNKSCCLLLKKASHSLKLSHRALFKIIKVARTIADLAAASEITQVHIVEALGYRQRS